MVIRAVTTTCKAIRERFDFSVRSTVWSDIVRYTVGRGLRTA